MSFVHTFFFFFSISILINILYYSFYNYPLIKTLNLIYYKLLFKFKKKKLYKYNIYILKI